MSSESFKRDSSEGRVETSFPHSRLAADLCSSKRLLLCRKAGDSTTVELNKIWKAERQNETKKTKRHREGVAKLSPMSCVIIMPNAIETGSKTAKPPRILAGAISARKTGPTHKPRPEPTPMRNLPRTRKKMELVRPIKAVPIPIKMAQRRWVPRRPHLSMTRFATRLPARPPTVKIAVTKENSTSDIGIQLDGRTVALVGSSDLQVKTACIWLRTEMW